MPKPTEAGIDRLLADAGVPEWRHPPYLTTARRIFATLAVQALDGIAPTADQTAELVRNAHTFTARYWTARRHPDMHRLEVLGAYRTAWTGLAGVAVSRNGTITGRTKYRIPSIRRTDAAHEGRHTPEMLAAADARFPALAATATARIQGVFGSALKITPDTGPITRWTNLGLTIDLDGRDWRGISWGADDLVHLADEDLLRRIDEAIEQIDHSRGVLARIRRARPNAQTILDEAAAATGLPVSLSLVPDPRRRIQAHPETAWIMLHGYGQGGRPARILMRTVVAGHITVEELQPMILRIVKMQQGLHDRFGPHPGAWSTGWTIDAVSATAAAGQPGLVNRCIDKGAATGEDGVQLRIAGRAILGTVPLAPGITWKGDKLVLVDMPLPESLLQTLAGRRVEEVVASPLLKDAGEISKVMVDTVARKSRITMKVKPRMVPIDGIGS